MSAPIQIVDEHDRPLRAGTKQEAWQKGLWHRVIEIMLEDGKGNVLLQHRSPGKDTYPNCWDDSVGGHVDAGEDYLEAAYRELREELGVEGVELKEAGAFSYTNTWHGLQFKRFVKVYKAAIAGTPKSHEPDKIDEVRWFTVAETKRLIKDHPDRVADTLEHVFARYY
jgi:16S rRNA (adenine1518-N6/adenine1519-N6)-dimethyltransferase